MLLMNSAACLVNYIGNIIVSLERGTEGSLKTNGVEIKGNSIASLLVASK